MFQKLPRQFQPTNIGRFGEDIAVSYLRTKGFRILDRNFRARYGEIDIIAKDGDTLVFVEVKTRTGVSYGTPEEAITARKLHEVIQTAEYYVSLHPELPKLLRIDVIGIQKAAPHEKLFITHTPNVTM